MQAGREGGRAGRTKGEEEEERRRRRRRRRRRKKGRWRLR